MAKKDSNPIVLVRWRDAVSQEASDPATEVTPHLATLAEVGWLIGSDADCIVIGMEKDEDDEMVPGRWRLHIPKVNIISIDFLVRRRARKTVPAAPQEASTKGE